MARAQGITFLILIAVLCVADLANAAKRSPPKAKAKHAIARKSPPKKAPNTKPSPKKPA